jgi:hypothetical protein
MNWAPTDRALSRLALAVLRSAIADRDAGFVASPYAARYCELASVSFPRYQVAYLTHVGRLPRDPRDA